jgi:hypothetical protein
MIGAIYKSERWKRERELPLNGNLYKKEREGGTGVGATKLSIITGRCSR